MKGFKDSTRMQVVSGYAKGGYAKGGYAKGGKACGPRGAAQIAKNNAKFKRGKE